MNSGDKVIVFSIGITAAAIVVSVALSLAYFHVRNQIALKMVQAGADPIYAYCSLTSEPGKDRICIIATTKK